MARGQKEIKEWGKKYRFSSTNQPARRGRSPISETIRQMRKAGYARPSYSDVTELFSMLSQLPFSKIESIVKDDSQAMITRVVAKEICDNKNGFTAIQYLLDRIYGKPTQMNENINYNNDMQRPVIIIDGEEAQEIEQDGESDTHSEEL